MTQETAWEREAFEQYGRENWLMCGLDFDRRPDGTYTSHETHRMWCCYRSGVQAAKAQAPPEPITKETEMNTHTMQESLRQLEDAVTKHIAASDARLAEAHQQVIELTEEKARGQIDSGATISSLQFLLNEYEAEVKQFKPRLDAYRAALAEHRAALLSLVNLEDMRIWLDTRPVLSASQADRDLEAKTFEQYTKERAGRWTIAREVAEKGLPQ